MTENKRLTETELTEIRERAEYVANSDWYSSAISDLAEEYVPKLLAEIERYKKVLKEIATPGSGKGYWEAKKALEEREDTE
jgi:hypothetical protein